MKIVICTGIYPPEVGGPAEYAKNLAEVWKSLGHEVSVKIFSKWNFLFTGLRHLVYFFSIVPKIVFADYVLLLDTYSCALPGVLAGRLFGKKIVLRTGGDFLWESYVERTGDLALLREFYKTKIPNFSLKEKVIFGITRWILKNVDAIVWSTEWQKNIFMKPYGLSTQRNFIVENYYGQRLSSFVPNKKNFVAMTRKLKWKHIEQLQKIFRRKEVSLSGIILDTAIVPHDEFLEKMRHSYAVIIASLGDISPNTILDAIRCGKPFILTKETGLIPRIKDIGIFVDPQNEDDIAEKILWLSKEENYQEQKKKIESFTFVHSWEDIAEEFMDVYNHIK